MPLKKFNNNFLVIVVTAFVVLALTQCSKRDNETTIYDFEHNLADLNQIQIIGKKIFFDKNLSAPAGQSCASCHNPTTGFSDPQLKTFSEGVVPGSFTNRNAPPLAYLSFSPVRYFDDVDSTFVGGLFLDGRVNTLEEQVRFPLLNHLEMNNSSIAEIVSKVSQANYASLFKNTFGKNIFADTTAAFDAISKAVAEFERSEQVSPFSSKYDAYLAGETTLTAQELHGLQLFNDTAKGKCANCHPSDDDNDFGAALFTDFTYDNIGLPHNPNATSVQPDLGLGAIVNNPSMNGQFKVPSLRNVAVSAPYFHNGYFDNLNDAVRFYSERDVPGKFPVPEVNQNVNKDELGNLNLTPQEIDDIVAFLKTLTDGYQ